MSTSSLGDHTLRRIQDDAYLRGADLTSADLRGANLTSADLRGAMLSSATWTDGRTCAAGSIGSCN